MNIPIKIYSYAIFISILIILAISVYLYLLPSTTAFEKTFIIWFTIILELNLIHLYYILQFYHSNITKKGPKGPKGDVGPRGFKGYSDKCISCGSAGMNVVKYGGMINDKGEQDPNAKRGKCQYPFIHNYKYEFDGCIKSDPPPGQEDNETFNANINGWCATETDSKNKVIEYGYCNENASIQDKMSKEKAYNDARNNYINNNYGILDVDVVHGNTEKEAIKKCDSKGSNYSILKNKDGGNQDLNEGIGGKFLYLCSKTGFGSLGVSELYAGDKDTLPQNKNYKIIGDDGKGIDLNEDSPSAEVPLYMYQEKTTEDFIKELKILKISDDGIEKGCKKAFGNGWKPITGNFNLNDVNGSADDAEANKVHSLTLCENRVATVNNIDNAFTYKGKLYIFRGDEFYKMTKEPIQSTVKAEEEYPKHISERWFSGDDCSRFISDECNDHIKCHWNSDVDSSTSANPDSKGLCESITYNAAFTYGHDSKTYFFNGGNVFKYDDKQMKIEDGYPKPINEVFKGVPTNIDAVFTWPKDGKTYFFKGPQYYKYNDKKQEIESGYPRPTQNRWKGFPDHIDAIFTVDISLESKPDTHPTYVISNGQSYYMDSITDELKDENKKPIEERFKMFDIKKENSATTTVVGTTSAAKT